MTAPTLYGSILVVEDDSGLCELIREELEDAGHTVSTAADGHSGARLLGEPYDLVISDLRLPGEDGLALLERSRAQPVPPGFIVITAFGTIAQAVEALKRGADDFLTKPLQLDHLQLCVQRALELRTLQREVARYRSLHAAEEDGLHGMIGRSPAMRRLFDQIGRIAAAEGAVLVLGESGVGKELVARALHAESARANGPFVALNCAGIPAELLESELFGHAAGAFTGARHARKGLFAEAEGGSILLDEIGEMPVTMQSKLLRILENGCVRPVGENRERYLDVRVIAATNRDLEEAVAAGDFRADLFYRLDTFALQVPPLRDRGEDLDLLTARFISRFGASARPPVEGITAEALANLRRYPFPGNVRELSNALERAVAFCRHGEIGLDDLPNRIRAAGTDSSPDGAPGSLTSPSGTALLPLREMERRYVREVLDQCHGNKRQAARLLGIGRRTLYRYLDDDEPTS